MTRVFKVLWFIAGAVMAVLAVLLGGVGFSPVERWIRRPIRHPDGSVTVEGGIVQLPKTPAPGKEFFGFVTVSTTKVVLSIDKEAKFAQVVIPLAGAEIDVLDHDDKKDFWARVLVTTTKGGEYRLSFHPEHVEVLLDLFRAAVPSE
ncbi:hypothetical protein ABT061_13185 [Streptosporangium sp. NPDC002544]|uniref:hypothetical protein n=1 Tax=Streptosporangium sp. NPDC002544 TaxID=3154538 RepID=UPI00332082A2